MMGFATARAAREPALRQPRTEAGRPAARPRSGADPLQDLQRGAGNRAVSRLLALRGGVPQTKLVVGPPGDEYEREADRVADEVLRAPGPHAAPAGPAPPALRRKCAACAAGGAPCAECAEEDEEEHAVHRSEASGAPAAGAAPGPAAERAVGGLSGGRPLPAPERAFFEARFGRSFEDVRIHDDGAADAAARALHARAFTLGRHIAFARGEYRPESEAGRRLLAHELTHTLQQGAPRLVRRQCGACRSGWETTVADDHTRALDMLDNTIAKIASYDGTTPADVKTALDKWFKASSSAFASWINFNLRYLRLMAPLADYHCELSTCGLCDVPGRYGWSAWCVPFMDIRVCDPVYFSMSDRRRSMGLVHEWVHKYGCNFDFGYCDSSECPGGTTRSLFNADPWAKLVLDLG